MLAERAFYCCLGIWLRIAAECEENLKKRKPAACNGLLRGILTGICVFGVTLSGCSSSNPETADTAGAETITQSSPAEETSIEEAEAAVDAAQVEAVLQSDAEIPLKLNELCALNADAYAWLEIPGTGISQPILQSSIDDEYYLTHNAAKEEAEDGAIYTEKVNGKDFSSPNTVLYGHHMKDGSMFGCLDKYLDRDYFEKYNEVFLFTPEEKRTYHIIAAYEHPAEHILTSYDFSTTEGINDYLRQIPDFVADSGGVIQDETEITPPLLTLSTCTRNDKQKRCLVQGILVECEKKNQEE